VRTETVATPFGAGTATVAAFVGAGGFGERIVAGLAVNDTAMMLAGALPAALLALLVQWLFERLERRARRGRQLLCAQPQRQPRRHRRRVPEPARRHRGERPRWHRQNDDAKAVRGEMLN
jgi:hypothetical protein